MANMRNEKGQFVKGHPVFPGTEKTRFKKGLVPWCAGKSRADDSRIAQPWLGKKRPDLKKTGAAKTMFRKKADRRITAQGYIELYNGVGGSGILEHRKVMEDFLGRKLMRAEHVHHLNGDKRDNRLENLMLFSSASEHTKFHVQHGYGRRQRL